MALSVWLSVCVIVPRRTRVGEQLDIDDGALNGFVRLALCLCDCPQKNPGR